MKKVLFVLAGLAAAVLMAVASAGAGTVSTTANVTGGSLSLQHGTSTASFSVTLDGNDKSATWTMPMTVTDARGTGSGWNVTITSTLFSNGLTGNNLRTLPANASNVTGVSVTCTPGGVCTNPSNAISFPVGVPAGASAPTAVKFFNAAANTGMGQFSITPTIETAIPANVSSGTYASTVTVALVSGP